MVGGGRPVDVRPPEHDAAAPPAGVGGEGALTMNSRKSEFLSAGNPRPGAIGGSFGEAARAQDPETFRFGASPEAAHPLQSCSWRPPKKRRRCA